MLGWVVIEGEQHVEVVGNLPGRFRPLDPVLGGERRAEGPVCADFDEGQVGPKAEPALDLADPHCWGTVPVPLRLVHPFVADG